MSDIKHVPVITANFAPFNLIVRDGDIWEPSIDDINKHSYDYVKLNRLSTYIDVGITPFSLGIAFDGTLILPRIEKFKDHFKAHELFNRVLTCLLLGGIYCEAILPDDIGYGSLTFDGYSRIHGGATGSIGSFHKAARLKKLSILDAIRLYEPNKIHVDKLAASYREGSNLLEKMGSNSLEQLLYGATFFVRKQWAESLLHFWTSTERLVEISWQRTIVKSSDEQYSKKRRQFLEDNRTWTVSTKLEVLFQKSLISLELYTFLDVIRKARNDFAHRGTVPTFEIAKMSLECFFKFASLLISEYQNESNFNQVVIEIIDKCNVGLYPVKKSYKTEEVSFWMQLPPLPGDINWGDEPYEIIDELCLKELKTD